MSTPRHVAAACVMALLLSACASTSPQPDGGIAPFTTDGCSLFPDRSPGGKADWCSCCVAHDLVYWRGGTAEERHKADQDLKACVRQSSSGLLAAFMYAGVRLGGVPYFNTTFRWGYGWPYYRPYGPLGSDEAASASLRERAYLAGHPALSCPAPPPSGQ